MPPRKRARVSQAASPSPTAQAKSPTPADTSPSKAEEQILNDPWTDEEEIGLFKGLMKWKPTGIHKHFRLMALHQYLLNNDYIHPYNEHTRPQGIWRKLQTLYNLEALDEREDARQLSDLSDESGRGEDEEEDGDVYSEAVNRIHREDFALGDADFGDLKWQQRLASDKEKKDESPAVLPELNLADKAPVRFTPSFSIEPEDTATPTARRRPGRPPRQRETPTVSGPTKGKRRSARHTELAGEEETEEQAAGAEDRDEARGESEVDDSDEKSGDGEDQAGSTAEEDDSEDEGDEDNDEEEAASETSTPARRSKAARGAPSRGRGRGRPRGRGRGR